MEKNFLELKDHILNKIENTDINELPYYNLYIQNIFSDDFYLLLKEKMLFYKKNKPLEDRNWDSPDFINKMFKLENISDNIIMTVKKLFDDNDIKKALLKKFYVDYNHYNEICFNKDMQFVYTKKDKVQQIHTDIPEQFISLIFYLPETDLNEEEQLNNGTITYDKDLKPNKIAKYKANSLFCFAPHFYSYHGFSTTIDNRNILLFFYSNKLMLQKFYGNVDNKNGYLNPDNFKNRIEEKIIKYPLIEYTKNCNFLDKLQQEKNNCKINDKNGRIKY